MGRKKGKKRKAPPEPKWRCVKRVFLKLGFTGFDEFAFNIQCKDIAKELPRHLKPGSAQFENTAYHLFNWNFEGCNENSDGMSITDMKKHLKKPKKSRVDRDDDKEESDLEDKQVSDLEDKEVESPPRKRRSVPQKRKSVPQKRKIPSPPRDPLDSLPEDDEDIPPPPSPARRRRRLRDKIEPLEDLDEDIRDVQNSQGSAPPKASPILDDDVFPDLDDDEDVQEEEVSKPKPPSPPQNNDDEFLSSIGLGASIQDSMELLPPPSSASMAALEDENGDAGEEAEPEEPEAVEENHREEVKPEEREWDEKVVTIFFNQLDPDDATKYVEEEITVKEESVRTTTNLRRLVRKIKKRYNLKIVTYDLILETPDGEVAVRNEDAEVTELDTIHEIREQYRIEHIYVHVKFNIMVKIQLYAEGTGKVPHEKTLCFKNVATLDRIRSEFDDFEHEYIWVDGKKLSEKQATSRRFTPNEVSTVIIADGTIPVPGKPTSTQPD